MALSFIGCNQKKDDLLDKDNPVAIIIWHYYNGALKQKFDEIVSKFNETVGAQKGIVAEAYSQGNVDELNIKVLDALNHKIGADKAPDIFASYVDTAYAIDAMGMVADLNEYLTEEERDEYIPAYIYEGQFDENNSLKLFPIAKATEVMILNKTDWDKFAAATGASKDSLSTWEGIADTAKRYYEWTDSLTPEPDDGKPFFGRDAMANYMIVGCYQLGRELFQIENGKVTVNLDKSVIRRLWDNYYVPYVSGHYAAIGRFRSDDVKTGDIIAFVGSTSGASFFPSEITLPDGNTYPIEAEVLPLPNFEDTNPVAVQQGAGMVVTKSTRQKEYAAVTFLKWFTDAEQNLDFTINTAYLPVKKESNNIEILEKAISESLVPVNDVVQEVFHVGIEMTQNYMLYTSKPFNNSVYARQILENALQSKADSDLAAINALIDAGLSRKEAIARFTTDENFNKWYEEFAAALKEIE